MKTYLRLLQIITSQPIRSTTLELFRPQRGKYSLPLFVGISLMFATLNTQAAVVDFLFTGTITDGRDDANWFQGVFPWHSTFTGEIRYDTSMASSGYPSPSDPNAAVQYTFNLGPGNPVAMSVSGAGGHTFSSATPFYVNTYDNYGVNPSYPGLTPFDELYYASYANFNFDGSPLAMSYYFADFGVHFNSTVLTSTTSTDLPAVPPDLSAFANSYFNVYVFAGTGNGPLAYIQGTITSVTPVPEPAAGVFLLLAGALLFARKRE
ncbi:MAG: hypothetical protein ABSB84_13125 [Verrucomicrobiota bacterium]|jgi:hypothetical protein